jgi:hypothetical protein
MRAAESKPYPNQYSTRAAAFLHGLQPVAHMDVQDSRAGVEAVDRYLGWFFPGHGKPPFGRAIHPSCRIVRKASNTAVQAKAIRPPLPCVGWRRSNWPTTRPPVARLTGTPVKVIWPLSIR